MTDTKKMIIAGIVVIVLVVFYFIGSKTGKISTPGQPLFSTPAPKENEIRENYVVTIENQSFNPTNSIIKAGETVSFVNQSQADHRAIADDGSFDTGVIKPNNEITITFNNPGTFSYHCALHPEMTGTIVVE